jgi:prepilin-type N-terminal cleavage/methylation domain-containing protein
MLKILKSSRGDTLIEVMISMAVIATVLGSAYAISSRSIKVGRLAQERVEAVKLLESQLETLKSRVKKARGDIALVPELGNTNEYCYVSGLVSATSACKNIASIYDIKLSRASNDIFTARAEWTSLSGVSSSSELVYRINKDSY